MAKEQYGNLRAELSSGAQRQEIEGALPYTLLKGLSAYEIAVKYGFEGTEEQWLESLNGKSAYQIAVKYGFSGTEEEWNDLQESLHRQTQRLYDDTLVLKNNVITMSNQVASNVTIVNNAKDSVKQSEANTLSYKNIAEEESRKSKDNAILSKQYSDDAKRYKDEAFSATPEGYDKVVDAALYGIKRTKERKIDSQEGSILLSANGMSHQEVLSGKNLILFPYLSGKSLTDAGVVFTLNEDDRSVTVSGTHNGSSRTSTYAFGQWWESDFKHNNFFVKAGTKIFISSGTTDDRVYLNVIIFNAETGTCYSSPKVKSTPVSIAIEVDSYIAIAIVVPSTGSAFNIGNVVIKPMCMILPTRERNLIPFPYKNIEMYGTKYTRYGITTKIKDDGSITISGTCTSSSGIYMQIVSRESENEALLLKAGTYTFSGYPNTQRYATLQIRTIGSNAKTLASLDYTHESVTFTLDEDTYVTVGISMGYNQTVEENVYYPQLELGETATPYEPVDISYEPPTGGEGSPSPNYPAEIKSANVKVKTVGKNLINTTPGLEVIKTINQIVSSNGIWNGNIFTVNGLDFIYNDDGGVTVNGKATSNTVFYWCIRSNPDLNETIVPDGTYFLSFGQSGTSNTYFGYINSRIVETGANANGKYSYDNSPIIFANKMRLGVYIQINSDQTVNNLTFKPQLIELEPRERNLIPFPYYSGMKLSSNGIEWTVNEDGSVTVNGNATANSWYQMSNNKYDFSEYAGKTVVLSCENKNGYGARIDFYKSDGSNAGNVTVQNRDFSVYTIPNDTMYAECKMFVLSGTTVENLTLHPQLELGEVVTEYEPPKHPLSYYTTYEPYRVTEADTDITLRAIEVTANDEYTYEKDGKYYVADELRMVNDRYEVVRRVKEIIVDGVNVDYSYYTSNDFRKQINVRSVYNTDVKHDTSKYSKNATSNILKPSLYSSNSDNGITVANNKSIVLYMPLYMPFTSLSEANEWAKSNNVIIDYILATPTIEPISTEDAKKLLSLKSWKDTTHVYNDSEVDAPITIMYGDTEVACKSLSGYNKSLVNEIEFSEIKKALLEMTSNMADVAYTGDFNDLENVPNVAIASE